MPTRDGTLWIDRKANFVDSAHSQTIIARSGFLSGKVYVNQFIGLIRTMRPKQWLKNGFIFVPLLFDRKLDEPTFVIKTLIGFALLCLISSTVYLINDLADIKADQAHPTKRNRPLPSGKLSKPVAIAAAILFPAVCIPLAFGLNFNFMLIVIIYLISQILYSFWLKHVVLIDVLILASAYLLRVVAGVELVDVLRFSPWLYLFTGTLALFIGFGKRRQELVLIEGNSTSTRAILKEYTVGLLDEMIMISTTMTLMTYSLYTFSAEGLPKNHSMMLTIPFVLYGVLRYLYLIHVRGEGGAPDEVILRDYPLQATVALWGLSILLLLYLFPDAP
jgi:4-hydroxybenzoate polyprenyltransferase